MSTKLQENLDNWATQLQKAVDFVAKYPGLTTFVDHVGITATEGVQIYVWPQDAEKVADLFGTMGWTAIADGKKYDWKRIIDGVRVTVFNMEDVPKHFQEKPVKPSQWPLQIKDTQPVPVPANADVF